MEAREVVRHLAFGLKKGAARRGGRSRRSVAVYMRHLVSSLAWGVAVVSYPRTGAPKHDLGCFPGLGAPLGRRRPSALGPVTQPNGSVNRGMRSYRRVPGRMPPVLRRLGHHPRERLARSSRSSMCRSTARFAADEANRAGSIYPAGQSRARSSNLGMNWTTVKRVGGPSAGPRSDFKNGGAILVKVKG